MKYRHRVFEVDAVQWTARNLDEVHTICPDAYTLDSGWTLAIPIPEERRVAGLQNHLEAHVGYYVVRTKGGLCVPMMSTHFEDAYEVLP
jgi:hypothetical protein